MAPGRHLPTQRGAAADSSSPDALGVVRNLPACLAGAAFHPPVAPARAVPNLQDGPEESRIARGTVLALARVAEGRRVIGVEPSTAVSGLLVDVLGPALADRPPMPSLDLRPLDLDGGIGMRSPRGRRSGGETRHGDEPLVVRRTLPRTAQGGDSPPVQPWLASHPVTFITLQTGSRAGVQSLSKA